MRSRPRAHRTRGWVGGIAAALLCAPLLAAFGAPGAAHAAGSTFYVDCTGGNDSDSGTSDNPFKTVEHAISEANGATGSVTIRISPGTCSVSNKITITNLDVTIQGAGEENTILQASEAINSVFRIGSDASDSDDVTLSDLTVDGNDNAHDGISFIGNAEASLTVSNVIVTKSRDTGITAHAHDRASVVIDETTVKSNGAGSGGNTAGVVLDSDGVDSEITVKGSTIDSNKGIGVVLDNLFGTVSIEKSRITHSGFRGVTLNAAPNEGDSESPGHVTIAETSIRDNGDDGINARFAAPITVSIDKTTVTENSGVGLAALANTELGTYSDVAAVNVVNSTFADNGSDSEVFAMADQNTGVLLDMQFSTLRAPDDPGDAALVLDGANAAVSHGILDAGENNDAVMLSDDAGFSADHTLARHIGQSTVAAQDLLFGGDGNIINEDPQLGPLADNGGATLTALPADTSPVVDAGLDESDFTSPPSTDQRGAPRFGSPADFGAVELVHETVTATPADPDVTQAVCDGDAATSPTVTLPDDTDQFDYSLDGEVAAGQTVTVTATVNDHVVIAADDDSDWETESDGTSATLEIPLDAAPDCTPNGDNGTPPADDGDETPGGDEGGRTPGGDEGGQPPSGDDSQPTTPADPKTATPEDPTIVQPTCREGEPYGPQVDLASTRGLTYDLDGSLDPGTTATVSVTAASGYTIDATDADGWSTSDDGTATLTIAIDDPHCDAAATPAPAGDATDELAATGSTVPPWGGADLAALLMLLGALGLVRARQVRKARH